MDTATPRENVSRTLTCRAKKDLLQRVLNASAGPVVKLLAVPDSPGVVTINGVRFWRASIRSLVQARMLIPGPSGRFGEFVYAGQRKAGRGEQ